jgi:hypothetical protein
VYGRLFRHSSAHFPIPCAFLDGPRLRTLKEDPLFLRSPQRLIPLPLKLPTLESTELDKSEGDARHLEQHSRLGLPSLASTECDKIMSAECVYYCSSKVARDNVLGA